MWQNLIVAAIVAAALLHFCTKYLPAAWRRQIVFWLARRGVDQDKAAALFKTTPDCGSGCGACGSCGTDSKAPAAASGDAGSAPLKRVIPLRVQR
ncbi:hypothetical protein ASF61_13250 [Duganella sp. Leaf126]|uniref:DUF6587 family protein n=1 Tax=Duganella sp. Leaf126 TaxID=1736266 RepID=UPI000700C6E6|nr:DUF6587 family protein [Duganella sp. Leaf126]KQQ33042.1 hypothetical protein ASF61_13250 [Duganella sp. Leaf126]